MSKRTKRSRGVRGVRYFFKLLICSFSLSCDKKIQWGYVV